MSRFHLVLAVPALLGFAACASTTKNDSLSHVDDLLGRVESVQVECVVAKEKSHAAYDSLRMIVAPEFQGDPTAVYTTLLEKLHESRTQAAKLASTITPLKNSAENVFIQWTANLESFGNTRLRQQSQSRLADTRARYDAIITAATTAMVSYESLNADLNDNALFLQHDFNAASVSTIAAEVEVLAAQVQELDTRLDTTIAAAKRYVESSALRGQLSVTATDVRPAPVQNTSATTTTNTTMTTPRRRPRATTTLPPPQPAPAGNETPTSGNSHNTDTVPPGGKNSQSL